MRITAFGETYRPAVETPPVPCVSCSHSGGKVIGRLKSRMFGTAEPSAPAGVFACPGCGRSWGVFDQVLDDVISSGRAPWQGPGLVESHVARVELAESWMDDAWGDQAAKSVEALPGIVSNVEAIRYMLVLLQQEAARRFNLTARDAFWLVSVFEFDPANPHANAAAAFDG